MGKVEKKKTQGRPTSYSVSLAEKICTEIAKGRSLRDVCKPENMPAASTVCLWVVKRRKANEDDPNEEMFSERYARARECQVLMRLDELYDIVDDSRNDYMVTKFGLQVNQENIQRSRLRADTRKWEISKIHPKYKDKLELASNPDNPIIPQNLTMLPLDELIKIRKQLETNESKT